MADSVSAENERSATDEGGAPIDSVKMHGKGCLSAGARTKVKHLVKARFAALFQKKHQNGTVGLRQRQRITDQIQPFGLWMIA